MHAERPPIQQEEIRQTLDAPDTDDGHQATWRHKARTIIVYYDEEQDFLDVHAVSATRREIRPSL